MPPVPHDDAPETLRFAYTIPSREVIEVVKAVAATGSILPIAPPNPNATWSLEFSGPALECSNISDTLSAEIRANIASSAGVGEACTAYGYLAWLEGVPFVNGSSSGEASDSGYVFNSRIFQGTSMPAALFLVASPNAMAVDEHNAPPAACEEGPETYYEAEAGAIMLRCDMRASTYRTSFNYTNGLQEVIVSTELLDDLPIETVSSVNCTTSGDGNGSCELSPELLHTLSYQAIMDAVTYLITGFISAEQNDTTPLISTQVISTALISTPELDFLAQPILKQDSSSGARTLQQNILTWQDTKDEGLVRTTLRDPSRSLAETIEQLFQNATVSMMSQEHLQ